MIEEEKKANRMKVKVPFFLLKIKQFCFFKFFIIIFFFLRKKLIEKSIGKRKVVDFHYRFVKATLAAAAAAATVVLVAGAKLSTP